MGTAMLAITKTVIVILLFDWKTKTKPKISTKVTS